MQNSVDAQWKEECYLNEQIERPDTYFVCACFSIYLRAFHLKRKLVMK